MATTSQASIVNVFLCLLALFCGKPAFACDFETLRFKADFEGARLSTCEALGDNRYVLHVTPESEPINPSPWYAFSVEHKGTPVPVTIGILAHNASPRYLPKLSLDRKVWHALDFAVTEQQLVMTLPASATKMYVAAQELITLQDYQDWMQRPLLKQRFSSAMLGESVEKRPLVGLIAEKEGNNEWLIIIGRQHPPEITGALALFTFIDTLLSEPASSMFFDRFNVLLVPLVNPDGVVAGHWRHNMNGIDLNRDWAQATQPETQAVRKMLDNIVARQHRIVFALDFHSTQQDIFYTMPDAEGIAPLGFTSNWLGIVKQHALSSFTVREKAGAKRGSGVFKQFIADQYSVHGVTFEVGDNTDRKMVSHVASVSAQTLMTQLLATPAAAFLIQTP